MLIRANAIRLMRRPTFAASLIGGAAGLLSPSLAHAHFTLQTPASWAQQDGAGSPQKSGPCGETDLATGTVQAVPTNVVTSFRPGQQIMITIDERVFHPGHYRVSLATTDRSQLPADPAVTAGDMACGTAITETTAVFPVLADGALTHTTPFTAPQSFMVTLPSNVTCTKCTLQVIEFMSEHGLNNPGGCFYHHCADISILPDGGTTTATIDAGPRDASNDRATTGTGGSMGTGGGGVGTGGGTGVSTGAGGSTGMGGAVSGSGGSSTGTGGIQATDASAPGTGESSSSGTAGASSGSGGSTGVAGASTAGGPASDGSSDGGGCALVTSPSSGSAFVGGLALLGLTSFVRRRRQRAARR
jgi:hypothetical protein